MSARRIRRLGHRSAIGASTLSALRPRRSATSSTHGSVGDDAFICRAATEHHSGRVR